MASIRSAPLDRKTKHGKTAMGRTAIPIPVSSGTNKPWSARGARQVRSKIAAQDETQSNTDGGEPKERKMIETEELVIRTLGKCYTTLLEQMQPQNLFRRFREKKLFPFVMIRDLQELPSTSEKNRRIQDLVCKNTDMYKKFKICLADTGQSPLVETLQICEIKLHDDMKASDYQCDCKNTENCRKLLEVRCSPAIYARAALALPQEENTILQLQSNLINIYEEFCQRIPVYPLRPENTYSVDALYVQQNLHVVNPFGRKSHSATQSTINTSKLKNSEGRKSSCVDCYRKIFYSKGTPCKNIYIVAEAGLGKSTLCERFVSTWCKAQTARQKNGDAELTEDEEMMAEFPLLFYISLSAASEENDIEEMIKSQQLSSTDISKFLEKEKCLVILDGLDEWKPKDYKPTRFITKGLPGRRLNMERTTIITTTRPWKLEALRLREHEIDNQINIEGLSQSSVENLAEKVMAILRGGQKEKRPKEKLVGEFTKQLEASGLRHFMEIPVLLMQMLCLWCDGIPFGSSQCDIYSNMIERQLRLAEVTDKVHEFEARRKSEELVLPDCLTKNRNCHKYEWLLQSLSRLAFKTFVNTERENALVFDHEETQIHNMTPIDVELCFRIGLLTQNLFFGTITQNLKIIGFIHKTHHEYFAACLLASLMQSDHFDRVCQVVTSLEMVLEMEKMLVFACGMNPACGRELLKNILEQLGKESDISVYRHSCLEPESESAYSTVLQMQKIILNCTIETEQNKCPDVSFPIADLVFVDEIFINISKCIYNLNPTSIRSACISTDSVKDSEKTEEYENIVKFVGKSKCLEKLYVDDRRGVIDIEIMLPIMCSKRSTLCSIVLSNINILKLQDRLETVLFSSKLTSLGLINVNLTAAQLEILTNFLAESKQLCELHIASLICGSNKPSCYKLDLREHKNLQKLYLRDLYVSEVHLEATKLLTCEIGYLHSHGVTKDILTFLKEEAKLRLFECSGCRSQADIDALTGSLRSFFTLREVILQNIDFGKSVPRLSSNAEHLRSVKLVNVEIAQTSLKKMFVSLPSDEIYVSLDRMKVVSDEGDEEGDIVEYIKETFPNVFVTWNQCKIVDNKKRLRLITQK